MNKIKSTSAFVTLSSAMLLCFAAGAAFISFSLGTLGFIVMGTGLMLSLFIWSAFFAL